MERLIPDFMIAEIDVRLEKTRRAMAECGLEAILVSGNANICYVSGRFFRGYVYIPLEGQARYFVIRPNCYEGENMRMIRKPEQIAEILAGEGMPVPKNIGIEFDTLSYSEALRLQKCFPNSALENCSAVLRRARMEKTDFEIRQMEIDGEKQARVYSLISNVFVPGMTDVQFQIEIERLLRLEGSIGYYRTSGSLMEIGMGSVLVGDNADAPTPYDFAVGGAGMDSGLPVGANGTVIRPGTTVMVDMNGAFNSYQTDMTRLWARGELPEIALRLHETSREILRHLETIGLPGLPVAQLYNEAMEIVRRHGFEEYFMGYTQKAAFIGHGVGIELNEQPVVMAKSRDILAENMTLALEPKFVLPGVGALGVENTYVVTPSGLRNLTIGPEEIAFLK